MLLQSIVLNKLIFPESFTAILICFILLVDLFIVEKYKVITYLLTQIGLLTIILLILWNFTDLFNVQNIQEEKVFLIHNGFTLNPQINFLKLILVGFIWMIIGYSKDYIKSHKNFYGEYLVLNMLAMLGAMLAISSRNLFNLYFGVELLSLPIYGLIALGDQKYHLEAALKYFILGSIFSGILLYGLSLLYGAIGSLDLDSIVNFIIVGNISALFKLGITLVFIGLFFKLNLVPFHVWVPDVYHGSVPTVGMLIATIPKITMVAIVSYLLQELLSRSVDYNWQNLLIIVSLSSIIIGNLGAILQNNIKRLLGYLATANTGFMLLGLATNQKSGMLAANLYAIIYSLMALGMLGIIAIFANNNSKVRLEYIEDFVGLAKRYPWLSAMLLIIVLSMAGVPPTAGFYVRFLIIKELIAANLTKVAIISLLLCVMAWFYCIKIIKSMYFMVPSTVNRVNLGKPDFFKVPASTGLLFSINVILILVTGLFSCFGTIVHRLSLLGAY